MFDAAGAHAGCDRLLAGSPEVTDRFLVLADESKSCFSHRLVIRNAVDVLIANRGGVIVSVLA